MSISLTDRVANLSEAVIMMHRSDPKVTICLCADLLWIDDELVAWDGDVVIITSKENNKLQAIVKLNSFVDAYLLAGRLLMLMFWPH